MSEIEQQVSELFCAAAELHGHTAEVTGDGQVTITPPRGPRVEHLENLIRQVASAPQQDRAALVADHLGTVLAVDEVDGQDRLIDRDFAEVKTSVRTRLYPDSIEDELECVCRTLASDLVQRVVLDSVHGISPVTSQMRRQWQVTDNELFALAEHNTRADGPLAIGRADFPDDAPPWFLLKGGHYTSAHALWLGDYPDTIGPAGVLFTVPSELGIFTAPIHGIDILVAGEILARIGVRHHAEDPWPISQNLYRWHDNHITLAAYVQQSDADGLTMHPTEQFVALLNQLAD